MPKYGQAAIIATTLFHQNKYPTPQEAWHASTLQVFTTTASRSKGCPRGAYLGLCEEGLVNGVPKGKYCNSIKNKKYAIAAIEILKQQLNIAHTEKSLWLQIMKGEQKVYNHQMDVVLSLWNEGLLIK